MRLHAIKQKVRWDVVKKTIDEIKWDDILYVYVVWEEMKFEYEFGLNGMR